MSVQFLISMLFMIIGAGLKSNGVNYLPGILIGVGMGICLRPWIDRYFLRRVRGAI